jgi:hypothetical protein
MTGEKTSNGVSYSWKYGGNWGTETVCVLQVRGTTEEQIEEAKVEITKYTDCENFEVEDAR